MGRRNEAYRGVNNTNERSVGTRIVAGIGAVGVVAAGVAGCGSNSSIGFSKGPSIEYAKLCRESEDLAVVSRPLGRLKNYEPARDKNELFEQVEQAFETSGTTSREYGVEYVHYPWQSVNLTPKQKEQFMDSVRLIWENIIDREKLPHDEWREEVANDYNASVAILNEEGPVYDEKTGNFEGRACALTEKPDDFELNYPN